MSAPEAAGGASAGAGDSLCHSCFRIVPKFGHNFHTFTQKYEVLLRYISIDHELLADDREAKAWCYSEQVLFHQKRKI